MKNHLTLATLAAAILCSVPSLAAAIDAQEVNAAQIKSKPIERPARKPPEPDAAIVKLQVLLDRAGVSPGVIDGYFGDKSPASKRSNSFPSTGSLTRMCLRD